MARHGSPWLIVAAIVAPGQPTHAASGAGDGLTLATKMFVERVDTDLNGRARRVLTSAERASPGDRIVTVIDWRNTGDQAVRGGMLTRPLPIGARLEATGGDALVSVDGGASWGRLRQLWVPTPLGGTRRALPEDVTHVRWRLGEAIAPGETGRISYRATIR